MHLECCCNACPPIAEGRWTRGKCHKDQIFWCRWHQWRKSRSRRWSHTSKVNCQQRVCIEVTETYPIDESDFVKAYPMRQQCVSKCRQRTFVSHHELLGCHLDHGLAVGISDHEVDGQTQEVVLGCGNVCNWLLTKPVKWKLFVWSNRKLFSIHLTPKIQKTETQKSLKSADEIAKEKLQQFVHTPAGCRELEMRRVQSSRLCTIWISSSAIE